MGRIVVFAIVVVAVAVAAVVAARRRPQAPTQGRWPVPTQLDRADFDRPDLPWLVAVFTSATCMSCDEALSRARAHEGHDTAVQEVEVGARRDLHARYGVEAVPVLVVADPDGVVRASFAGPPSAADLAEALAEARGTGGREGENG